MKAVTRQGPRDMQVTEVTDLDGFGSVAVAVEDVLGVEDFATHRLPLSEPPSAYATFQAKDDGMVKTVFRP